MGFSRQEYLNGLPCPPPGDLPDPGIKPMSPVAPAVQADLLPLSHQGSPLNSINTWKSMFTATLYLMLKQNLSGGLGALDYLSCQFSPVFLLFFNLIIVSNKVSWSQPEIFLKIKILPRTLRFNLLPQVSTCLFCELDIKGLGIVLSLTFYFLLIISNISRKVKVLIGLFRITFCFLILLHLPWNLQEMEKVAIWICRMLKI